MKKNSSLFSMGWIPTAILFASCGLVGQLASDESTSGTNSRSTDNVVADISGKVVDAVTGEGISGATLRIKTIPEDSDVDESSEEGSEEVATNWEEATTTADDASTANFNEAGEFWISSVVTKGVDIPVEVVYNSSSLLKYAVATSYATYVSTVDLYFAADETESIRHYDLGNIGLVEDQGSIAGTVFSATGTIEGVVVWLYNTTAQAGKNLSKTATTDGNGAFSFTSLPQTSGYTIATIPVDANSDGYIDFGSVTDSIDLSYAGLNALEQNIALVLPSFGQTLDLNWTNIAAYDAYETPILSSDATLSFYFNKPVANNQSLSINCTDTFAGIIAPVTAEVDSSNTTRVTATPLSLINGHSYSCAISASTAFGELYQSSSNSTFMVASSSDVGTISDFAFDIVSTTTASTCTAASHASFDELADDCTTLNGVFTFSLPDNITFFEVFVRNDDVDSTNSVFNFNNPTQVSDANSEFTTGATIDVTEISTDQTSVSLQISSLQNSLADYGTTGRSSSIFLVVRTCNEDYIGVNPADESNNCGYSNVLELTDESE
jgi:hypothetical protein